MQVVPLVNESMIFCELSISRTVSTVKTVKVIDEMAKMYRRHFLMQLSLIYSDGI